AVLMWAPGARAQVAAPAPDSVNVGDWHIAPVIEARVRGEYRHDLDGQDRGALLERARLGADAERGPIEMRVVLEDARLWDLGDGFDSFGQQPTGQLLQPGQLAFTGAYEAWADAHTAGARPSFVRVGRQPVTWGEGRLLGTADWSPTGRTLDAVRGRLVAGSWAFEVLAASLSDPVPPNGALLAPAYGELVGARAEWALDPLFGVELYTLERFAQQNPTASLDESVWGETYTGALRLHGDARGWTWGAEGAGQVGHASVLDKDRLAWAAAGHVGYTLEYVRFLPTVRLGASYASGDDGTSSKREQFDPLLPDVHEWHGAMDLFAWSNEIEGNARVSIAPWTDGVAAVEYRYAQLATADGTWVSSYLLSLGRAPGNTSASLGHEIDAYLAWSPWVPVELSAGYSMLVLGSGARAVLEADRLTPPDIAHYAYGQATVKLP
ncbi:MAG TPA: alginate export family protein, partial [Solirubrobacteraceae bacterium]|nr:alginate export family protein [Solirubrobacteraceae bacterium]